MLRLTAAVFLLLLSAFPINAQQTPAELEFGSIKCGGCPCGTPCPSSPPPPSPSPPPPTPQLPPPTPKSPPYCPPPPPSPPSPANVPSGPIYPSSPNSPSSIYFTGPPGQGLYPIDQNSAAAAVNMGMMLLAVGLTIPMILYFW